MRFTEFAPTIQQPDKPAVNPLVIKSILTYIQAGNWPRAIMMGAISAAPQLKQHLTSEQWSVLDYAVKTIGSMTFWDGLSSFMTRVGVPALALAGWHGKLNAGEDDELKARRIAQAEWEFAPE